MEWRERTRAQLHIAYDNTRGIDWLDCPSAHSQPLNANMKAYAAWWLFARLAGWSG